jgi:cytidylate kinase
MTSLPPVVTVAALYGANGSVIGPRVADRLGVEFLDRAIPTAVARESGLAEDALGAIDEQPRTRSERVISTLARVSNPTTATGVGVERVYTDERKMRSDMEAFLARASREGGVVLGRGGAVVLRDVPGALHVYLGGAEDARIERAMERESIDRQTAKRRLVASDRARRAYVKGAYGVDGDDPALYHLMIDTTALELDASVDLIVLASERRRDAQPA